MSLITDMVIVTAIDEDEAIRRVNQWCADNDVRYEHGQQFAGLVRPAFDLVDAEQSAGGAKVFCSQIWAMAGNYFPSEELADVFGSFGWRCPEGVVLTVSSEADDTAQVRVYRADGARLG